MLALVQVFSHERQFLATRVPRRRLGGSENTRYKIRNRCGGADLMSRVCIGWFDFVTIWGAV